MKYPNKLLELFMLLKNEPKSTTLLVGGCVRDIFMGKIPHDYDVVTDVTMDRIEKVFCEEGWKVKSSGKQFLVLNVYKDGRGYEIANFRKESGFVDGRRPLVCEIGTIEEDCRRRDFTVNGLYYDPFADELIDLVGGEQDTKDKVLRFIGNPHERIKEDYLRVFRFYRFLLKGFTADKKSLKACRELFREAYMKTTPERVRVELEKMTGGE